MEKLFAATRNTRPILPAPSLRFVRSDVPLAVTETERAYLLRRDIHILLDLRTHAERAAAPCPLEQDNRFTYLHMPVTGGGRVPARPEDVAESYAAMADQQMLQILTQFIRQDGGILFFCTAGKDRTGVVAALLLRYIGFSEEYILADYLQSGPNLAPLLVDCVAAHPEADPQVFYPKAEYLQSFLRRMEEADFFGRLRQYLDS